MYGTGNPRDTVIIMGNTIVEAPMSHRCRYFENYAFRDLINTWWESDQRIGWKVAPKPSMSDSMFDSSFWGELTSEEREERFNRTF